MKAIAIDDEPLALDVIKKFSKNISFLDLKATFTNAFKALDYLQNEKIDLLFLDINMPDISGIEFFDSLKQKPLLIFTTGYSEHAAQGFDMDAVDYLLKPFSLPRFMKSCNKAYQQFSYQFSEEKDSNFFFIKTGYKQIKVSFEDILYLEGLGNYVTFVLQNEQILSRNTFAEVTDQLPKKKFIRVHRSYIVALNKIEKIEFNVITINKKRIPISKTYRKDLAVALENLNSF